jgi:hypothetical protein
MFEWRSWDQCRPDLKKDTYEVTDIGAEKDINGIESLFEDCYLKG